MHTRVRTCKVGFYKMLMKRSIFTCTGRLKGSNRFPQFTVASSIGEWSRSQTNRQEWMWAIPFAYSTVARKCWVVILTRFTHTHFYTSWCSNHSLMTHHVILTVSSIQLMSDWMCKWCLIFYCGRSNQDYLLVIPGDYSSWLWWISKDHPVKLLSYWRTNTQTDG